MWILVPTTQPFRDKPMGKHGTEDNGRQWPQVFNINSYQFVSSNDYLVSRTDYLRNHTHQWTLHKNAYLGSFQGRFTVAPFFLRVKVMSYECRDMVSGMMATPPMACYDPEVKLDLSTRELRSLKAVHRDQARSRHWKHEKVNERVGRVSRNKQLYLGCRLKSRGLWTLTFLKSSSFWELVVWFLGGKPNKVCCFWQLKFPDPLISFLVAILLSTTVVFLCFGIHEESLAWYIMKRETELKKLEDCWGLLGGRSGRG